MKRVTIFLDGAPLIMDYDPSVESNLIAFVESAMDKSHDGVMVWGGESNCGSVRAVLKCGRVYGYYMRDVPPESPSSADKMISFVQKLVDSEQSGDDWKKP